MALSFLNSQIYQKYMNSKLVINDNFSNNVKILDHNPTSKFSVRKERQTCIGDCQKFLVQCVSRQMNHIVYSKMFLKMIVRDFNIVWSQFPFDTNIFQDAVPNK